MQGLLPATFRRTLVALIFFAAIAFTCETKTLAQGPSPAEIERARIRAERDMAAREWQLRNIGKVKRVDVDVAPPQVPLRKVKEDYEGLQAANNDILKMLAAKKGLDYQLIADSATKIRKRAGRLKSYLVMLQLVEDNEERNRNLDRIEAEQIQPALLSLDASIFSLISSPVFRDFGKVVDMESSNKARKDLDQIMDLSERIKKTVEQSIKASRASR